MQSYTPKKIKTFTDLLADEFGTVEDHVFIIPVSSLDGFGESMDFENHEEAKQQKKLVAPDSPNKTKALI